MKSFKSFLFISVLCAMIFPVFAKTPEITESSLYNEIVYAFNMGFYPGTLEKIDQLEKKFPDSEYKQECEFIQGQAYYYQKKYGKAIDCFYKICENPEHTFYYQSILYSARAFYNRQEFEKAVPLLEYIISNGKYFDTQSYVESLKRLFLSYNNLGDKDKTTALLNQFSKEDFGETVYEELKFQPDSQLADFYRAKKLVTENQFAEAEKQLETMKKSIDDCDSQKLKDSYYALCMRCYALQGKWNKVLECYDKISELNNNTIYFASFAAYFTKDYAKVVELLENKIYLKDLYSVSLALQLFNQKKYAESYKVSSVLKLPEGMYLSGLNCINLKNWRRAKFHFDSYLSTKPVNPYLCWFYKGYAEYSLGEHKSAYNSFYNYLSQKENQQYDRTACELAIKSSINLNDFGKTSEIMKIMTGLKGTEVQNFNTALYCSELYTEYKYYDEAIEFLKPYTQTSINPAVRMQALYNIAQIYEKRADFENALNSYKTVYKDYETEGLGEESLYRMGLLLVNNKEYFEAEKVFYDYIYQYVNGANVDSAMFWCGECYWKNGKTDHAIMMFKTLISKSSDVTYLYGSSRNLMNIYYELGMYSEAYDAANVLVKNYGTQAAADGIADKQREIKKIISGTDKAIVLKASEYAKYGKNSVKGRIAGTELVQMYYAVESSREDACLLAQELLELQTADNELSYAAQNTEVIARYLNYKLEYENAAQKYLKAAELYRKVTSDEESQKEAGVKPAEMLYAAVECFVSARFHGDAEETAKLLMELYPQTKQAKAVKSLLLSR